jgi:hypothetical protein
LLPLGKIKPALSLLKGVENCPLPDPPSSTLPLPGIDFGISSQDVDTMAKAWNSKPRIILSKSAGKHQFVLRGAVPRR